MAQVLLLPGLFGSALYTLPEGDIFPRQFWPPQFDTAKGGLKELELAADGLAPGTLNTVGSLLVGRVVDEYYGSLFDAMVKAGHTVRQAPYDWRKSARTAALQPYLLLRDQFPVGPVVLVAHSWGGIVAKAVAAMAIAHGLTTYISKIIYLGTPQYGSFETYRLFWGLSDLYRRIVKVASGARYLVEGSIAPEYLAATIASFPSFFEILPFRNSGPLFTSDPAQARNLYTIAEYEGANPYVSLSRLATAWPEQDALAGQPAGVAGYLIRGVDFRTARSRLAGDHFNPGVPAGYEYTQDGDSFVTEAQATLPTMDGTTFSVAHNDLPLARVVQQWVLQLLAMV